MLGVGASLCHYIRLPAASSTATTCFGLSALQYEVSGPPAVSFTNREPGVNRAKCIET